MELSPRIRRAQLLIGQARWDMAIEELQAGRAESPGNPVIPALQAFCLIRLRRLNEAVKLAQEAIGLAPEYDFAHACLGRAYLVGGRYKQAAAAVEEALRIDPLDADHHWLMAAIQYSLDKFHEAIAQAEQGLAILPTHAGCLQIRSRALFRLGRTEQAAATLDTALADNPSNAHAHSMSGWTELDQGQYEQAQTHFLEALRSNPNWDEARIGLLKSLKAKFWPYRIALKYFLWMSKLSNRKRAVFTVLAFMLFPSLLDAIEQSTGVKWLKPLLGGIAFLGIYLTWIAEPACNALLLAHPVGRQALSTNERRAATGVAALLVFAMLALATWPLTQSWVSPASAFEAACLVIPFNLIFRIKKRWEQIGMAVIMAIILLTAVAGGAMILARGNAQGTVTGLPIGLLMISFGLVVLCLLEGMRDLEGKVDI